MQPLRIFLELTDLSDVFEPEEVCTFIYRKVQ